MMNWVRLILTLVFFAALTDAACRQVTLNSRNYAYVRNTLSGAAKVTSMTVRTRYSNSPCTRGVTFGSYGPDVWVNRGCRARFNVCYVSGRNTEVTCSSSGYAPSSCTVPMRVQSVAIKQHLSSAPCVEGFSFSVQGSNLKVINGCRARFVVGYMRGD